MQPPAGYVDLLERPFVVCFATVRDNGAPQAHPMWFVWDAESEVLRLTHIKTRRNYEFIRREPRVALLITDPENPYRYLQVRGAVDDIADDPRGDFFKSLQMRFRGRTSEVQDADVRVVITIRPQTFIAWGPEQTPFPIDPTTGR